MIGFFLVLPLRAPVVVRMITGRPPSSPPSAPPVASYRATWSRTRSLGLGAYCAPWLAPDVAAAAAGLASVLSFMWASPAFALCLGRLADGFSDGGAAAVGGDDRAGDVGRLGRRQEGDHVGDLARLGGAAEQGGAAERGGALRHRAVGVGRARGDSVHPNALGAELGRPGPGQRRERGLGGAVGRSPGQADLAGHAAEVDDRAGA